MKQWSIGTDYILLPSSVLESPEYIQELDTKLLIRFPVMQKGSSNLQKQIFTMDIFQFDIAFLLGVVLRYFKLKKTL